MTIEYDLVEYGFTIPQLQALGQLVLGGPVYLRLKDRKVVATVRMVAVKPNSLLLSIKFSDKFLEENIDRPEILALHYEFLDSVDACLHVPN